MSKHRPRTKPGQLRLDLTPEFQTNLTYLCTELDGAAWTKAVPFAVAYLADALRFQKRRELKKKEETDASSSERPA